MRALRLVTGLAVRPPYCKLPVLLKTEPSGPAPRPALPVRLFTIFCADLRESSALDWNVLGASRAAFGSSNRAYVGRGATRMWLRQDNTPAAAKSPRLMLQEHDGASNE